MNTTSRAQTTVAGRKSGGKIVKRRSYAVAKTPYDRPHPPPPPGNPGSNWLTGQVISNTSRMIAKGAMKFFAFMTDTNYISDTEDEDDVSCDDDVYAPFKVSKWKEKDSTSTEMIKKSPKWVIEQLLLQETFSREESDKLIEIINSRVVDCSPMGEGQAAGLVEMPSKRFGTPDRCSKAVMEAKHWLEGKKVGSSSKSDMDHGPSAFGSVPLQHKFDKGSPVDMAKSYMQACPPRASPSLRHSGLITPSPMATDHSKDEELSSIGGDSFPSAQRRDTLSARSWNIQDEIRKVRSKTAEDMLRTLPSKRTDLLVVSERKTFQNSVVPDDGSTGDKLHVSKSLPETEHVNRKLVAGSSTIHDSRESDTNSKDGSSRRYKVRNSGAPDNVASLRSRLSAGIKHNPKQSDNKPSTTISVEETLDGSQDLQDSAHQVDIKNGTPVYKGLNEKQQEKKSKNIRRKGRGRGK